MTDPRTIAAYDRCVEAYADMIGDAPPHPTLVAFAARLAPGGHVLDLGCGPAHDAAYLRERGCQIDPVDASPEMVTLANTTFAIGARQASFDDIQTLSRYDAIWANFSLLHAPADQFPGILQRLHRALKPGGIFHIAMKLGDGASRDKFDRLYTYYSQAALQRHLSDAGFTIIETTLGEDLGLAGDVEPWIALVCTPLSPSTA
ncbi:MAG: methyltransferase domain-containing protein [Hyphomicrobiaceae bacterium]